MSGPSPSDRPSPVVSGLAQGEHLAEELAQGAERLVDRVAPPAERELVRRALDLSTRKKFLLARRLWNDPRVRTATRFPMLVGAAYMLLPIRLLPARFGPVRQFEKLIGLGVLLWLIVRITPEEVLREHLDAIDRPGVLRRILRRD